MNNNDHPGNNSLRYEMTVSFSISLAIFLFTLFFRPFNTPQLISDNTILFMAGFGGINFILMLLFLVFLPKWVPRDLRLYLHDFGPSTIALGMIWILDSVAYGFYIRYVGEIPLSMFLMFKVVLMCFGAVVVLKVLYIKKSLNSQVDLLETKIAESREILDQFESTHQDDVIEIFSENHSEKISTTARELILLRSADNYVEIIYREEDRTVRKLIRNTLKNMEYLLARYQKFIRCHRSYIINIDYVEKLEKKYNIYSIRVREMDELLPVSRQYLMRLKEALEED